MVLPSKINVMVMDSQRKMRNSMVGSSTITVMAAIISHLSVYKGKLEDVRQSREQGKMLKSFLRSWDKKI